MICWECKEKVSKCHVVRYFSYIEDKVKSRDVCGACYSKLKFNSCHFVEVGKIRERSLQKEKIELLQDVDDNGISIGMIHDLVELMRYRETGLSPKEIKESQEELETYKRESISDKAKLGEIKILEGQGLLLRLPCKPGSLLYRTWIVEGREPVITECTGSLKFIVDNLKQFGKTIFTTREAAEEALKEAKEQAN